ncbi:MAG: hypothetical protein HZA16_03285 [Nitrospirae bacterium]|nr:hypothetical protein [Nitrospirota bacterium]
MDSCVAGSPTGADDNCNGTDENCNGTADENYAPAATSCGVGACASTGSTSCDAGAVVDSCVAGSPTGADDNCNGADENCNGTADENYAPAATSCGVGSCASAGSTSCEAGAVVDSCVAGTPSAETCNGIDDDCDGSTDENLTQPASCGVGACARTGIETCTNGVFGGYICTAGTPSTEICNNIDDDCDGSTDENLTQPTSCGVGACASTGIETCTNGVFGGDTCSAGTPSAEICNNADDDCDGAADENLTQPTSCGVGSCASTGTETCTTGNWGSNNCNPGAPSTEICSDGNDNDCDGLTDAMDPNCQTSNIDLTVISLYVPSTAFPGTNISVSGTTKNQGTDPAVASATKLYWSTDSSWDAGDTYLGTMAAQALEPGAGSSGIVTINVPAGACSGTFYIIAAADADGIIAEMSETNNYNSKPISTGPDLTVSDISAPTVSGAGKTITVTDTTRNVGGCPAAAATKIYLSEDSTWDAGDTELGGRAALTLASGASDTGSAVLTIPDGTFAGAYFIIAKADAEGIVAELNETNNYYIESISIGPDLMVSDFTAPASASAGETITVTDTTHNTGQGDAGTSTTGFYLSPDLAYDAGDTPLGSRAVAALAAGAFDAGSTDVIVPADTPGGAYYIIARANADGAVGELSGTNNYFSRQINVGPDLIVSALTAPAIAAEGDIISVTDTTNNVGDGDAEASTTGFYLSTDNEYDEATDTFIGSRTVQPVASGASDSGSASVTIPAGTGAGAYFIIAMANADGLVAELSGTNNYFSRQINIGPDLIVSALTVPASAGAGATISVSDVTGNIGAGEAGASTTWYYLSADYTFDAADTKIGERAVAAIAAGSTSAGSATLTIPAETGAGTYYIIAMANADGAAGELSGTNNYLSRSVNIGPDLIISALTVPASSGAGATISVTDTTNNVSAGNAGGSTTAYYLSADASYDAGDLSVGSRSVSALPSATASTGSATVTIPAGTSAGAYRIIAKADAGGAVAELSETNNYYVSSIINIGPDLAVTALTVPASAAAGSAVSVTDTTRNVGYGDVGASTTRFYLSADSTYGAGDTSIGDRAVAAMTSGSSNSGSATVTIPAGTAAGEYYIIAKADADGAVVELSETNNFYISTIIKIGPDLTVSNLTVPANAAAGATISVTDLTNNVGQGDAGASTTGFYLSADAAYDPGDALIGDRVVPVIAAGASNTGSASVTIPAGTSAGAYYIIAKADADDSVGELSETNNNFSKSIKIGPDLTVSALTVPDGAEAGSTISVTDTTVNAGQGDVAASTTGFYLSTNITFDATDTLIGSRSVPALATGATNIGSASVTIPAGITASTYFIIAKADAGGVVTELSESNNYYVSEAISVGPDLTVTAVSVPATARAGATISATDTTKNMGQGNAETTTTGFYLSANIFYDAEDTYIGGRSVPELATGALNTGSASLTIPADTVAGEYYIVARANADGAVAEFNGTNNFFTSTIIKIGPDLMMTALTVPVSAASGATISVTDTTKNLGPDDAGATTTGFYLSTDGSYDAGDTLIGSRTVEPLAAGASSSGSASVTIPAGTSAAPYYIIAKANAINAIAELNAANNNFAKPINIGTDFTVTALTAPSSTGAGATVSVTETTKNIGQGDAGVSTTSFYLSTDITYDAGDPLIGSRSVPVLASGATNTGSTLVTIPADTVAGEYYVIARANADGVVEEVSQTNNNYVSTLIRIGTDITVSALTAPSSAAAGATISVTDTTRNIGQGGAGESTTRFYLSTNTAYDAGDTSIGERAVEALAAGASSTVSTSVTIPAETTTGTYYIIAEANTDGAVVELSETNNYYISAPVKIGYDLMVSALTVPSGSGAGATITVTDSIKNIGQGSAGASTTRFYLSTNSTYDAGDTLIGERAVAAIAAGATNTGSASVTIPVGTTSGTFYIIAIADAAGVVVELLETNNNLSKAISIGPDLTVSALTAPSSAAAGATITVTDSTKNSGQGGAGASTTRFYLSTNSTYDAGDTLIGERAVAALTAGATDTGSASVTIPAGTAAGARYIIARSDATGIIAEKSETNNNYAKSITINP